VSHLVSEMDAFWKQADRWLLKCEAYEETLQIESEKAFSEKLRDGFVLCNLIHKLNPDALDIRQVQRSPAKQVLFNAAAL
jgi:Calponin homology (CH) domain